ncbi:MAG TPA: response regulator [Blastocatellia bacterium]|nr:response regulator [Blastocatellia bacterium]
MAKIIAAIDDMFFASKVNAVAQQVGATLIYAKTPDDIIAKAEAEQPSLIIFDLNSVRSQPTETINSLKQNPELKSIPILGYLSHVQIDLQQQALDAGCDKVVPRSVFAQNLSAILSGTI